jgi:hypothetical protein
MPSPSLDMGGIVPVSFLSHHGKCMYKKKTASSSPGISCLGFIGPPLPRIMMSDDDMPRRSRRLLQLELEAGILPLPVTAPPPVKRTPALPPVVLRVMPLRGSPAPIGYIYDATPDPNGGLLTAALAFISHQGHQVVHDQCPDLGAYHRTLGVGAIIIPVDNLPDHILLSGLDLLESLFAPSLS